MTEKQHEELVGAAEANHRSLQGEIIHRLFASESDLRVVDGAGRVVALVGDERHFRPDFGTKLKK